MSQPIEPAKPIHGPHCTVMIPGGALRETIDYERWCVSAHCSWCGQVGSMWVPCGCEWSKKKEVKPA